MYLLKKLSFPTIDWSSDNTIFSLDTQCNNKFASSLTLFWRILKAKKYQTGSRLYSLLLFSGTPTYSYIYPEM